MAIQSNRYEKIWLALIPVIGGIIIALINYWPPEKKADVTIPEKKDNKMLFSRAGKVSEISAFNNYNDLYPLMADGLKAILTREIFNAAHDSMSYHLGEYIRPIDTTDSESNGYTYYAIRNQYRKGQGITLITFDNHGQVMSLFCKPIPR